jgi:CRP-like cAMP-binding protein
MAKQGARFLDRRVFHDGQVVFAEGARGDLAYLIEKGEIQLSVNAGSDAEVEIAKVGDRGIFGEMALFDDSPRMATAKAKGPVVAIAIGRDEFQRRVATLDPDVRKLFDLLIQYSRKTPIFSERRKDPDAAEETRLDAAVRGALSSPAAETAGAQKDAFLAALFNILESYAGRRLPPA